MGYSGGLYDLFASALGLSISQCLQYFMIPTSNESDGLMFSNIGQKAKIFDGCSPNARNLNWECCCSLAFDSMSCESSFVVNYHIYKSVGIKIHSLETNVIMKELNV